jgi:hypothetical protein
VILDFSPRGIGIPLDIVDRGLMDKDPNSILATQSLQLRDVWSNLFLVLQRDEDISINEDLGSVCTYCDRGRPET